MRVARDGDAFSKEDGHAPRQTSALFADKLQAGMAGWSTCSLPAHRSCELRAEGCMTDISAHLCFSSQPSAVMHP